MGRGRRRLRKKPRRQAQGREGKARDHAGPGLLAALGPDALQGRPQRHAGKPKRRVGQQRHFPIGAHIRQHKRPGRAALQQGRQPGAHVAAHKGRGLGRHIDGRQTRHVRHDVTGKIQPVGRGAEARYVAIQKNGRHGGIGRQTQAHDPAHAPHRQPFRHGLQLTADQRRQNAAALRLPRHSQTGHDVRAGPGLRIKPVPLRRRPALLIHGLPVQRGSAQVHGQDQIRERVDL